MLSIFLIGLALSMDAFSIALGIGTINISKIKSVYGLFYYCSKLINLDIRNFDFTNITDKRVMFQGVPTMCEIIVKSDTERDWIHTNVQSNLTNIKTIVELEEA